MFNSKKQLKIGIILVFWIATLIYSYLFGRMIEEGIHQEVLTKISDLNQCVRKL